MASRELHKLFNQLTAANPSDEEVAELYEDLRYVFDSPFDKAIDEAITMRGCAYIEQVQAMPN